MSFWEGVMLGAAIVCLVEWAFDAARVRLARRGACPTCREARR